MPVTLAQVHVQRDYEVKNTRLLTWVEEMIELCQPERVYWCDGSQKEYDRLLETELPPVPKMVASNNLAYILSTCPDDSLRDGKRAVELIENVKELVKPLSPELLDTLAAAYAEVGDFESAEPAMAA